MTKDNGKSVEVLTCDNCECKFFEQVHCVTLKKVDHAKESVIEPYEVGIFVRCATCLKVLVSPQIISKVRKPGDLVTPDQIKGMGNLPKFEL